MFMFIILVVKDLDVGVNFSEFQMLVLESDFEFFFLVG